MLIRDMRLDSMAQWYCTKMYVAQIEEHTLASQAEKMHKIKSIFGKYIDYAELLFADTVDHPVSSKLVMATFGTSKPHWDILMDEHMKNIGIYYIRDEYGFWLCIYMSQLSDGRKYVWGDE